MPFSFPLFSFALSCRQPTRSPHKAHRAPPVKRTLPRMGIYNVIIALFSQFVRYFFTFFAILSALRKHFAACATVPPYPHTPRKSKTPTFRRPLTLLLRTYPNPTSPRRPCPFRPLRTNTTLESMGIQVDISPHHGYFPAKKP